MIRRIGDFMAWLGGADRAVLDQVPQGRARFVQMAGVLLTTAGIAVLSMVFALHDAMKIALFPALVLGLLWGFVIINLDRFLVISMGTTRGRWNLVLTALPRLALAVVLSLVISTPLVLRVFASDIKAQLYTTRLEDSTRQAQLESHSKEQQQLNQVLTQISTDNGILNGNVPPATSPQMKTAQAQVAKLQPQVNSDRQAADNAYEKWRCELTGEHCAGSSGKTGNGPRAETYQQEYEQAHATYVMANGQLQQALAAERTAQAGVAKAQPGDLARAQQQARQALPQLVKERDQLKAFIHGETAYGSKVNESDTGLLAQLQALSDASAKNPSLNAARLAVTALFFLIEILPVTVKLLLNLAPPTAYEIVAKLKDEEITDGARARRVEKRRIEERKSQARVNVEDDMRKREEDLGRQANKHVAAEMTKILDVALQDWSHQVRTTLTANGSAANGSAAAPGSANGYPAAQGPAAQGPAAQGPAPRGYAPSGYTPGHTAAPGFVPNGYAINGQAANGQAANGHGANGASGGQDPGANGASPPRVQRSGGFSLPDGDAL
jgi:Domain of unknown function (DUF4407)